MKGYAIASVVLSLACSQAFALADNVEKQLNANYVAMSAAFKKKDVDAFGKFYLPGYTGTDGRGRAINLTTLLASLKKQMVSAQDAVWTRKVLKVKVNGNEADATVGGRFTGKLIMGDGKLHTLTVDSVGQNIWVKVGGKWLLKSAKPISNKMTQDGKPMLVPSVTPMAKSGH